MAVIDHFDELDEDQGGTHRRSGGGVFGVVSDPRTWGAIVYMLLGLPLGIAYFTFVVVGLSLSLSLAILIVGVLIALTFIALTRGISMVEGYITGALLGAKIPHREELTLDENSDAEGESEKTDNRFWGWTKTVFKDLRTWTSMLYMGLMLPLGVGYFTLVVTGFVTSIALTFGPVASLFSDEIHFIEITGDEPEILLPLAQFANSPLGLVAMSILGIVMFFVMLHVSRGIGWLHARLAETMLVKRA